MRSRGHHRHAIWLAFFSVSLYALWPLLATLQPRGAGTHYELCPHASLHQMAQQSGREAPSPNPIWNDHQLQCAFSLSAGDGASAVATTPVVLALYAPRSAEQAVPADPISRPVHHFYATAPRGPPPV